MQAALRQAMCSIGCTNVTFYVPRHHSRKVLAKNSGACRGGRIHTQWGCREVLYQETSEGTEAVGLRMTKAGKEQIVEADVYVAALDVPGVPSLLLLCTSARLCDAFYAAFASYHAQCTLAITSSAKH